jgi:putative ABC transport system permease protein
MGAITRGFKNAFRNGVRSVSVILILSIAIGMTLIMFMSLKTVQGKIDSVKSSIGNTVTVSPAGVRGFEGGGTLLTAQNVTDISALSHVVSTTSILSDRLSQPGSTQPNRNGSANTSTSNNTTNLTSSISPGSFGNRQRSVTSASNGQTPPASFTMPVQVMGISDLSSSNSLAALGVNQFNVTTGNKIDANSSDNIAMVGKDLATKNNLNVGSTFQAYGQNVIVSGIFDAGSTFSNAVVVMPIKSLQNLSAQAGQIDSVIVSTDSIDTVSSVKDAISNKLGSSTVDVTSQQDASNNAIAPLENIKSISLYSLIGSMIAGAVILFLTMIMIVRERRREIGVLKAIGSSNLMVTAQFAVEALVLTVSSAIIGIILGTFLSNPILKVLVSSNTTTAASQGGGGRGAMVARFGAGIANGAQGAIRGLTATVSISIILYGLLAAIAIAIIGSVIPSFIIAKISPAEVMRAE